VSFEFANSAQVWLVTSGPCTVTGDGCIVSPNFKPGSEEQDDNCLATAGNYGPNQTCTFDLVKESSPAIQVVEFTTEKGFDIFTVNDVEYSGSGQGSGAKDICRLKHHICNMM